MDDTPKPERLAPAATPIANTRQQLLKRRQVMHKQALELIEDGHTWRQVEKLLRAMFTVSRATAQRVASRARAALAQEVSTSTVVARGTSYVRYMKLFRSPDTEANTKVKILERIDKLLGTEAPQRVAIGPDAELVAQREVASRLDDETLAKLAAAYDEANEGGTKRNDG